MAFSPLILIGLLRDDPSSRYAGSFSQKISSRCLTQAVLLIGPPRDTQWSHAWKGGSVLEFYGRGTVFPTFCPDSEAVHLLPSICQVAAAASPTRTHVPCHCVFFHKLTCLLNTLSSFGSDSLTVPSPRLPFFTVRTVFLLTYSTFRSLSTCRGSTFRGRRGSDSFSHLDLMVPSALIFFDFRCCGSAKLQPSSGQKPASTVLRSFVIPCV